MPRPTRTTYVLRAFALTVAIAFAAGLVLKASDALSGPPKNAAPAMKKAADAGTAATDGGTAVNVKEELKFLPATKSGAFRIRESKPEPSPAQAQQAVPQQ